MIFDKRIIQDINLLLDRIDEQIIGSDLPIVILKFNQNDKDRTEIALVKLRDLGAIRIGSEIVEHGTDGKSGTWQIEIEDLYDKVAAKYRDARESAIIVTSNSYSRASSELRLVDISIKFRGKQSELLTVLFQDSETLSRLWNNDEVIEIWEPNTTINKRLIRSVQDAGLSVNRKVASTTSNLVPGILLVTSKTIRVDPKYL